MSLRDNKIKEIKALAEYHEVGRILHELIQTDGAGSWPPNANHDMSTWPQALQPYVEIYLEMAPFLPQATPSCDDEVNMTRILAFRQRYDDLLHERVDLAGVVKSTRIQVGYHPGPSNLVLKFNTKGNYVYEINAGMAPEVVAGEETFARIFYDVEILGVPIYCDMVHAIVSFSRGDTAACAKHVADITSQLRLVTGSYMDKMHDKVIAQSIWLSKIQGFYGWGIGHFDAGDSKWERYDGLSGNQVLLFQALDAFLGIEQYLSTRDQERNVPLRQRELCHAMRKHSFRSMLSDMRYDGNVADIVKNIDAILKRLRLFRAAHRTRSKSYLSQPAPERLPMTAGKSLLAPEMEESLKFLDVFMERRLAQTV
ncbi:hypothetical protein ACEQ8H_005563 [Pleosporales sp. CAS-2024a]